MPNPVQLFSPSSQPTMATAPQADPTMPATQAQSGTPYQGMSAQSLQQLAKILGNSTPPPSPIGGPAPQLGNGQDTSQMTPQGYAMGGSGQQANINNAMGQPQPNNLWNGPGQQSATGWFG